LGKPTAQPWGSKNKRRMLQSEYETKRSGSVVAGGKKTKRTLSPRSSVPTQTSGRKRGKNEKALMNERKRKEKLRKRNVEGSADGLGRERTETKTLGRMGGRESPVDNRKGARGQIAHTKQGREKAEVGS